MGEGGGREKCRARAWLEWFFAADAYAVDLQPPSPLSTCVTVLVWIGCAVYIVFLALKLSRTPETKDVAVEWSKNAGPYPMRLACRAEGGCYLSNFVSDAFSFGQASRVPADQRDGCVFLEKGSYFDAFVAYSSVPSEGLSVVWRAGDTPASGALVGAGVTVESETPDCDHGGRDCRMLFETPVRAGTELGHLVETTNNTASGAAAFRREWFTFQASDTAAVDARATTCTQPDGSPFGAGWEQARIRMLAQYHKLEINRRVPWMEGLGEIGGAYELFLQAGLVILLTRAAWEGCAGLLRRNACLVDEGAGELKGVGTDTTDSGMSLGVDVGANGAGNGKLGAV
ncbi:unnamed protein product [Pedinophyceae sp. YPF-701]|nr:unnamed protein product [Pedinophyceae sp. YPF-701]